MALTLSALQEALKRSSGDPWLFLVTITHVSVPTPMRFVQGSHVSVVSNGNTFLPTRFDVKIGTQDIEGQSRAQLIIAAVDQVLLQTLQSLDPSPLIDLQACLASSPNTIQFQQLGMEISTFDVAGLTAIQVDLTGSNKLMEAFPGIIMDRINTPGIFTDN